MGIATHDPELRKRLIIEKGAKRVANYLNATAEELRVFGRCCGHEDIHDFSVEDIETVSSELSEHAGIPHV